MIKVEYTVQDLKVIEYLRFNHPIPLVQRRMEVIWVKGQGLAHKDIAKIANFCDNAVTKYTLHGHQLRFSLTHSPLRERVGVGVKKRRL